MCFQNDGKTFHAATCIKSIIITKLIDYVLSIDTFEQQYVVFKGILQSTRFKDQWQTIGIDQSLRNDSLYEHKCLQNIKKLYKHAVNFDYQQQLKDIFEAAMVSTLEGFTNNTHISPMTLTAVKRPSATKSMCLFTNILDVKKKTDTHQVGAAKSKRKIIKYGNTPWVLRKSEK